MRLVQFLDPDGPGDRPERVGVVVREEVVDLTACSAHPGSVYDLYYVHGGCERGLEATVQQMMSVSPELRTFSLHTLLEGRPDAEGPRLLRPVGPPPEAPHRLRVWLAGVTHADSARLREIEAKQSTGQTVNVYEQKHRECSEGGIPELFPKTDPRDLVGPGEDITKPRDTLRLVPETELVTVYGLDADGQIECLGYTGGNDCTDNGMEAQNPLNLPQAKNWHGGCASLGPVLVTESEFDDTDVPVSCSIIRGGARIAHKEGRTGSNNLNMPDGLLHLERSLFSRLPLMRDTLQVLYWGTPIVFADADLEEGLQEGDVVSLRFGGGIGVLENTVVAMESTDQLRRLEARRKV